ncbi:MAG: hypothetical protein ACI8QC_002341 [Planctomycetota bacterium]|jgi:hypothetical protein
MPKPLDRRTLLRGAGASLALPWLEAMLPARVSAPTPPVRLAWIYVPNGVHVGHWREPGVRLPRTLAPLQEFRERISLHAGLGQQNANSLGDGPGDHARASAAWLTCAHPLKDSGQVRLGISADQIAGRFLGQQTPLGSLVVGCQGSRFSGQCDSGYACAYSGHVSWQDEVTPAAKRQFPERIFDDLFRAGASPGTEVLAAQRRSGRAGVLDLVRGEAKRLAARVGTADRQRLERYLGAVGELEQRIANSARLLRPDVADELRPVGMPADLAEHAGQLGELIALAFATDVTRVATLMVANEGSGRVYREVGATEGHHPLSHHRKDPAKLAQIEAIDGLHAGILGSFLGRLTQVSEGDDDLLHSSLVLYGSGVADGNRHDHHNLPSVLCGEGGGAVTQGKDRGWEAHTPLGDLHLSMLHHAGVPLAPLGDARGPLAGL